MKKILTGGRRFLLIVTFLILVLMLFYLGIKGFIEGKTVHGMVMGGKYFEADRTDITDKSTLINGEGKGKSVSAKAVKENSSNDRGNAVSSSEEEQGDVETYFRPSKLPVLNTRFTHGFLDTYMFKKPSEIALPSSFFQTPEDTILNYFSVLREAANPTEGKGAGCGTLGNSDLPYPIAYDFLTKAYQERLPYEQYLKTFENILHISLLKYHSVPLYENPDNILRYFVELETIEGTERNQGSFAYYYGFLDLQKENGNYKISNLEFHGENYLCAPYHGWSYDADISVQARYGGWCDMIEKMYPTKQEGYIKKVSFRGKDGWDYRIVFYQLTNDTDIEIAQYRKGNTGEWELIKLNPEDCIKEKKKE